MQEVASDPGAGRRPAAAQQQQFAGVDLRRPKGYSPPPPVPAAATAAAGEGEPCPRCESRDTKFCYYNNYNTAQPRHFCKGCRRYWTKGGTLRNVPVGGGTRKKPSSSSSSASSSPSSAYAAAAKPKRPYKKKRRVAPPPEPAASPAAPDSAAKVAPTTATTTTDSAKVTADAASEITTELVVPAAAATEDDSLTRLLHADDDAVALGLGLSDLPSCKSALLEPDSFEWPASFDLGAACWGPTVGGFGDTVDPAMFLNLP